MGSGGETPAVGVCLFAFLLVPSLFKTDGQWGLKLRASAEKFKGICRKISIGGPTEKRPKNSTIKLLSTISGPCMKI